MATRVLSRPTGALAFLASAAIVYFLFHSLAAPSPSSPSLSPSPFKNAHPDPAPPSCPPHLGQTTHACQTAAHLSPPPPRTIVPTLLSLNAPGWTILQNLYYSNGTFFLVSPPAQGSFGGAYWPERKHMISTGLPLDASDEARMPSSDDMDIITPEQAEIRWGDRVFDIEGFSVLANDPTQFLRHYYHVAAELLLGIERMCTNLIPSPSPHGVSDAPYPERIMFLHTDEDGFTDGPGLDKFFLHALYPWITPLYQPAWEAMAELVSSPAKEGGKAWRFPVALLIDRSSAFWGKYTQFTSRPLAGAWAAGGGAFGKAGEGRERWWWEAARRRVLGFVGVSQEVLDIGLRGMDPPLAAPRTDGKEDVYQVTYISRQWTWNRRLVDEDHERLVAALEEVCRRRGWRFVFMQAEEMTREEQMRVAAETTIFVAVHGNGLTHLLLQPPHPRSAVIELFHPPGFARDYEYPCAILGRRYYTVHNDTVYTAPELARNEYPEWIIGRDIPVQSEVVVGVVEEQLGGVVRETGHWQSWMEGVGY